MNKFALFLKTSLVDPYIRSFRRFTDSITLSVLLVILGIINLELRGSWVWLAEILPYLWLTLPLLLFKTLLIEKIGLKLLWNYLLSAAALAITISLYLFIHHVFVTTDGINILRMSAAWVIAILLVLVVQYFPKRANFAHYLVYLLTKLFVTIFYAVVLYGGLFGIVASIEALFGLHFGNYVYIEILIAVIGLVAVPVFVGFLPKLEDEMSDANYHKVWKTVFAFIIVPLIMIFSAILIIYIITSFANRYYYGIIYLVSSLVTAFLSLAMIFFLEHYEGEYPHIRFFNKYWPYVILAIMAGFIYEFVVALINQGFTLATSTYFYLGLALIALSIVRIIKRPWRLSHGQIIGGTSLITAITLAFAPFINILSVTTYSANARFERLL
ncbi:MAG: hypothetical protein WC344_04920, partial [Bacilli bacterium]